MVRNTVFLFVLLALLAIAGFWPSYFSRVAAETQWRVHLHGAVMSSWCLMLIAQSGLMRAGRRDLHRLVGKASYALVPLILLSTLILARFRVHESAQRLTPEMLYGLYVVLSLLVLFGVTYALAIHYQHAPPLHLRYMLCTALPLIDPIGARLLYRHAGMSWPMVQAVTYGVIDAVLLGLIVWDRQRLRRFPVFVPMLALFAAVQAPTFFLYRLPWWHAFAAWFMRWPLP